ncbi:hypothetical protein [Streptomyces sp. NPDC002156]
MMRNSARKLAAVASCIVVTVGGLTTGAVTANAAPQERSIPEAAAAACVSTQYVKPAGNFNYPAYFPGGRWLIASRSCGGIWLHPSSNRYVKVCLGYSDGVQCPSSYTYARANTWTKLASDVQYATRYKFQFQTDGRSSGWHHG